MTMRMMKVAAAAIAAVLAAQSGYAERGKDLELTYVMENPYEVEAIEAPEGAEVKNVILMIGDGMSLSTVYSAWVANRGKLYLENAQSVGLSKTYCLNKLITDSGAGGTALASGKKTTRSSVGTDGDGNPVKSLVEYAHDNGLSSGINATCHLWDATPGAFGCHVKDRKYGDDVMAGYVECKADVVVGPGWGKMINREDGRNLFTELEGAGFQIARDLDEMKQYKGGKVFCVTDSCDTPLPRERGNYLERAALQTIDLLSKNDKGFFLMIEGSKIDHFEHGNDIELTMEEMHDFDRTVGAVFKWAAENGETLVVVTADHETGGLTLVNGDLNEGRIVCKFSTDYHSGVMVPVYAFGPGAEKFTGIYENSDVANKIIDVLNLK